MRRICLLLLCLVLTAFTVLAEETGETEALIEQAKELLTAEDYEAAISILQKEAEKGNAEAQNELGKCYANGTGVEQSDAEAFKYFQMAADQGYAKSLYNVGIHYEYGLGVDQDDTKAARYVKLAADQGLPDAQYVLGYYYEKGIGVEQDFEEAVKYYKLAADQGFADGQNMLACCYAQGLGVEEDDEVAVKYYQMAADQGYMPAQYNLANAYLKGEGVEQDAAKAEELFKACSDQGDADSQVLLGNCYLYGEGLEQDYERALEYLQLAADQEYAPAYNNLGVCFQMGWGVEQDYAKAIDYFKLAADQGLDCALYNLGTMYQSGYGVEQDYEKAFEYFNLSAEQGFPQAQAALGYLYSQGLGTKKDLEKMLEFYNLAVDQGDACAQFYLGNQYYIGEGVDQDYDKAFQLYQMSAEQGFSGGMFAYGDCYYLGNGVEQDLKTAAQWYQKALDAGYEPDETDQEHLREVMGTEREETQTETDFGKRAAPADEAGYTEKNTKIIKDGEASGELVLRFYEETPNVPYMGFDEYSRYMRQQPLTLRQEGELVILENEIGEQLTCNADTGVMTIEDWNRFFDQPLPLEDEALGWKDTATRFVRITAVDYEGEPEKVVLDFARYGIRVYADSEDIWLPVSVLSNMMTDIATNHLLYNGENLYAQRVDLEGKSPEGFWESEMFQAQMLGEKRPDDIIQQCYADLCFDFDYFFGHPGIAVLDAELAEKGLDQALTDLGSEGESIKEGLHSADLSEYISAVSSMFMRLLSDGHTVFMSGLTLSMEPSYQSNQSFLESLAPVFDMLQSPSTMKQLLHMIIPVQRKGMWGEKTYREAGSTAIIRLDTFMPDEAAWASYYSGEGDFPDDCLGIVISGLRKAAENPKIENIIFDLTCNSGGSPDVMMAILAVTTGQTQLYGKQKITGQNMTITFEADTNFDGVYDEKDKEVHYDFNYGVLTTRYAFSCGNLFPIIAQEGGAVLIGEPTSGGSCCVQVGSDAQGLSYMMSSAQWQLTDSDYNSVEGGCSIDLPIETKSSHVVDRIASVAGVDEGVPSFLKFFNAKRLDRMMNEWFESQSQTDLAA